MPPLDEYAVKPQDIKQGVVALKKRQRNLMLLGLTTSTIFIASLISLFFQQELVYGFFGLSTQVQQLHLPLQGIILNLLLRLPLQFLASIRAKLLQPLLVH